MNRSRGVRPSRGALARPVQRVLPALAFALALTLPVLPQRAHAADSLAVHSEFGVTGDASNELYYEDAYTDTTFLGRRLHGTPESRVAGVGEMELVGQRGALAFSVQPEFTLGNEVTRAASTVLLRLRQPDGWQYALEPRAEYLRDLGFGIDRRQTTFAATAKARRTFGDEKQDELDLRSTGEVMNTGRSADPYLLAHRIASVGAGWDHEPLLGTAWSGRYDLALRTFPDSVERDHVEHRFEGTVRHDFDGGHSLGLDAELAHRSTLHPAPTSRDRFDELRAEMIGVLRLQGAWSVRGTAESEAYRYAEPDSFFDFDYHVERYRVVLRRELPAGLSLEAGPRAEFLAAPWSPPERYREFAGAAELELLSPSCWWLFEPAAGRRLYANSESGGTTDPAALHSSYSFLELALLADQALPARLRLRLTVDARFEEHDDPSQDSRGFYFSADLRRLF